MPDLKLTQLQKRYGTSNAVDNVSLSVRHGEFLTLLGPSGCGKSTLLRLIAGLDTPDAGALHLGEDRIDQIRPSRRNIAMVFQSYALYPHMSVADNIATPLRMRQLTLRQRLPLIRHLSPSGRKKQTEINAIARARAKMLGLGGLLDRMPGQLSGGQRQRVALARAIVRDPALFLLDEPLSNLDAKLRVELRAELVRLNRELDVTFLYVTHDQTEAMTMSDRIAVMIGGRILQIDSPAKLYAEPNCLEVARFIGSPAINLFDARIRDGQFVEIAGHQLALSQRSPLDRVLVGCRPEHITMTDPQAHGIVGVIKTIEHTGPALFVHVETGINDTDVIISTPSETSLRWRTGDKVKLQLNITNSLIFNPTGPRIAGSKLAATPVEAA